MTGGPGDGRCLPLRFRLSHQSIHQPLWLELHQVGIGLAHAQKEHGLAGDVGDGDRGSALGVGIRLGKNGAIDGHRLIEEARPLHGIVSGYCFIHEDEQIAARLVLDDFEAQADSCLEGARAKNVSMDFAV
jgi:hypothetical protein